MILNRYFLKTIFSYTASVSVIFLLIIVSSRSIQYLDQAARGEINPEVVFWIILFRLPEFGQIILPLSFFIGIVLTLGKLRSESEFVVMQQNGFSSIRLHTLLVSCGILICGVIFSLSAWLTPQFDLHIKEMLEQKTLKEKIVALTPGEFHKISESTLIYSEESIDEDLIKVFIKNTPNKNQSRELLVFAEKAHAEESIKDSFNIKNGSLFFSDESENFSKLSFKEMKLKVSSETDVSPVKKQNLDALGPSDTIWLLSISVMTIISVFLAIPLSDGNPREGRYKKVLPALLVFSLYLGLLIASRGVSDLSLVNKIYSMVFVHLFFLILSFYLYFRKNHRV